MSLIWVTKLVPKVFIRCLDAHNKGCVAKGLTLLLITFHYRKVNRFSKKMLFLLKS